MATYEYRCEGCKKTFTVIQRIADHGKEQVTCPKCKKSDKVKQQITGFLIKTSRKS